MYLYKPASTIILLQVRLNKRYFSNWFLHVIGTICAGISRAKDGFPTCDPAKKQSTYLKRIDKHAKFIDD